MPSWLLNRIGMERAKDLVRTGRFVDQPWSFSADDSNAILGDPPNWTEYRKWFMGVDPALPDSASETTGRRPTKDDYAFPFGRDGVVYLSALRAIISRAGGTGDGQIQDAAKKILDDAEQQTSDRARARADENDLNAIHWLAPLTIQAAAADGADGRAGVPSFDMDAYTGGPMRLNGWEHPVVVDLKGIAPLGDTRRPVLRDHDKSKIVGHSTNSRIEHGVLKVSGVLSGHGPQREEVLESHKRGFPWQASIGARVVKNEFVPKGKSAEANGQVWDGPINLARQTYHGETSFVGLGADDSTSARIAASAAKGNSMNPAKKFSAWAKAKGYTAAALKASDDLMNCAKAMFKAEHSDGEDDSDKYEDDARDGKGGGEKPAPGSDDGAAPSAAAKAKAKAKAEALLDLLASSDLNDLLSDDTIQPQKAIRAVYAAEARRSAKIRRLCEKHPDIEAKALEEDWDEKDVELAVLRADRPTISAGGPYINTGAGGGVDGTIIAAAACLSVGLSEKTAMKGLDQRQANIASSGRLRAMGLHGIIALVAPNYGLRCHAGGIDDAFLADFLVADDVAHKRQKKDNDRIIQASSGAGFSTMSLSGITENIMFKAMLEAYNAVTSVVPELCYETDTNDFKLFKRYRLTVSGDLQVVGPTGELTNLSLQDESYQNQVITRGGLIVLSRENIINDDMGALTQTPTVLGRKAAINREKAVFTTFLSGTSTVAPGASIGKAANAFNFFSSGAANYQSGAASALSISSMTTAVTQFLQQKDANGDPIMIMPDRVLVGPENKTVAENLFNGANLTVTALTTPAVTSGPVQAANTASQAPNLNAHKGQYRPIVTPFLGAKSPVSGSTSTAWALLCNPSGGMATVSVGYLRGQRSPIIQQVETDARMLGIAYRLIYDFGVALADYRCGQFSAGA